MAAMSKAQISEVINTANSHLKNARELLSGDGVESLVGERVYYELMKEMNNVINGVVVCSEIASGKGRPTGT